MTTAKPDDKDSVLSDADKIEYLERALSRANARTLKLEHEAVEYHSQVLDAMHELGAVEGETILQLAWRTKEQMAMFRNAVPESQPLSVQALRDIIVRHTPNNAPGWWALFVEDAEKLIAAGSTSGSSDAKDAARYRFWREHWTHDDEEKFDELNDILGKAHVNTPDQVDAALDAAIALSATQERKAEDAAVLLTRKDGEPE